jgi:hypothetical protein
MTHKLQCFAQGRDGLWEAICVDLDISVQGRSFSDVYDTLNEAIGTYVEDALREDDRVAAQLLARRAPLHVRVQMALSFLVATIRSKGDDDGRSNAGFTVPCPA